MNVGRLASTQFASACVSGAENGSGPPSPGAEHSVRIVGVGLPVAAAPVAVGIDAVSKLTNAACQAVWISDRQDVELDTRRHLRRIAAEVLEQLAGKLHRIFFRSAVLPADEQHPF